MPTFLTVALPVPLRRTFEYLCPSELSSSALVGSRVLAPFGNQTLTGIIIATATSSTYELDKLKPILSILDDEPALTSDILLLCHWASEYYHHPIGEVLHAALPTQLRKAESPVVPLFWEHTEEGKGLPYDGLKRSPKQQILHQLLLNHGILSETQLKEMAITKAVIQAMSDKGLIRSRTDLPQHFLHQEMVLAESPQELNEEQRSIFEQLRFHQYQTYLLEGTTGSGKTEVYLHAIARTLQSGHQALILVPEIGLTPQTVQRLQNRFRVPVVQLHSNVADAERARNWQEASAGRARIVIGTRLAIFTPMPELGLIILDEEHDLSFKQQEGFRYSARDVAVVRAHRKSIPLILGSATPSLESLHNARSNKYTHLRIHKRAGGAQAPNLRILDMRKEIQEGGLGSTTLQAIRQTLARGEQALIFINRRGYAPAILCQHCGWVAACNACSTRLTLHSQPRHLRCHHCDAQRPVPFHCPSCKHPNLSALGQGTERCEQVLQQVFPDTEVVRVDQDSMRRKNAMAELSQKLNEGKPCILVGTQMLAKGHHFPKVTLAVLMDIDQGLFSGDFRGPERMGQQLIQVAGRAGRGSRPGQVILQTYQPDHPLLQQLITEGYSTFAHTLLQERAHNRVPPLWAMSLLRAECKRPENAVAFLQEALKMCREIAPPSPNHYYLGPLPALVEKRNHRFRYQLQIACAQRKSHQELLKRLLERLEKIALAQRVKWSLDVDPQDMS